MTKDQVAKAVEILIKLYEEQNKINIKKATKK